MICSLQFSLCEQPVPAHFKGCTVFHTMNVGYRCDTCTSPVGLSHAYSTDAPSLCLGSRSSGQMGTGDYLRMVNLALAWRWAVTCVTGVLLSSLGNRFVLGNGGDRGEQIVSCLWPITAQFELKLIMLKCICALCMTVTLILFSVFSG